MTTKAANKGIYIRSVEAAQLFEHLYRGNELKAQYVGMLPYSLLSIELDKMKDFKKMKVKIEKDEFGNEVGFKYISKDLINLKFTYSVKSTTENMLLKSKEVEYEKIKALIETGEAELAIADADYKEFITDNKGKKENPTYAKEKIKLSRNLHSIKKSQKSLRRRYDKLEKYIVRIGNLEKGTTEKWNEYGKGVLRQHFYENGFTLKEEDKDGKVTETDYVIFNRSSSKARKGEVVFIKKELHKEMTKWIRMGMEFDEVYKYDYISGDGEFDIKGYEDAISKAKKCDVVSLKAYESLCASSLVDTIKINHNSILVVSDIKSIFKDDNGVKVIQMDKDGRLESVLDDGNKKIANDIWDGQSLMDSNTYFKDKNYSFLLLRNHFFKSAGFEFDIQKFLSDYAKGRYDMDTWKVTDCFGNKILAKNITVITTKNSLKFLKFAYLFTENKSFAEYQKLDADTKKEAEKAMWKHWKAIVRTQDFGICKHEKPSQFELTKDGDRVHSLSYQMINTLLTDKGTMKDVSEYELGYINLLKNDLDTFVEYLNQTKNDNNLNQYYLNLIKINKDCQCTPEFKAFRSDKICSYIERVRQGKLKVARADYAVMVSNPYEMALHAVGAFKVEENEVESITLKENEVYCKLFEFGTDEEKKYIVGHRSPHTAPNNVLFLKNVDNDLIREYMKPSPNVVVINAISHNLMERGSGLDFDSDSLMLTDNHSIVKLGEKAQEYKTCVNEIAEEQANDYQLVPQSIAKADDKIALSGKQVGQVANLGQFAVSLHQHFTNLVKDNPEADEETIKRWKGNIDATNEIVEKCIALSTCCIDLSKKSFKISIASEIIKIRGQLIKMFELVGETRQKFKRLKLNKTKFNKINKVKFNKMKFKMPIVKPLFMKYIEKDKKKNNAVYKMHETPMDYIQVIFSGEEINRADTKETIPFRKLLAKLDRKKANRHQLKTLYAMNVIMIDFYKAIHASTSKTEKAEINIVVNDFSNEMKAKIRKLKIKPETIYVLIHDCYTKKHGEKCSWLLSVLCETHNDEFVKCFA